MYDTHKFFTAALICDFKLSGDEDKDKRQKNTKTRKSGKKAKSKTVSSNDNGEEKSKKKKRNVQNDSRQTASCKRTKMVPSTDSKDMPVTTKQLNQTRNDTSVSPSISSGWTELIPTEILLLIFQNVIKSISGSSVPFLCK